MNAEWSDLAKTMLEQLRKEATYHEGIETALVLRQKLMDEMVRIKNDLSVEDFSAIPYINTKGYHSKTLAYSLWHIFRIEDIVLHSLILHDEEILFKENYQSRIHASIITTGNELIKEEIAEFSKRLDIDELYRYISEVKNSTDQWLMNVTYKELKRKMTEEDKSYLKSLDVVSTSDNAYWLIDYWCGKTVKGLVQMPFSRHWIMHVEACIRIEKKIG